MLATPTCAISSASVAHASISSVPRTQLSHFPYDPRSAREKESLGRSKNTEHTSGNLRQIRVDAYAVQGRVLVGYVAEFSAIGVVEYLQPACFCGPRTSSNSSGAQKEQALTRLSGHSVLNPRSPTMRAIRRHRATPATKMAGREKWSFRNLTSLTTTIR